VYLIHFDKAFKHARHYLGKTADLRQRLADHRAGKGARLLAVLKQKGIGWRVVRTWERADKGLERRLKSLHRAELCPRCSGRAASGRGKR
jgi:predicted GIY-YIG superfamily endonuclease